MSFDIRHFEQFINERILKKGLRLFESGRVEYVGRQTGGESQFVVDGNYSLSLRKRADKLSAYTCSCGKAAYCEHLVAVLFYFQQDTLGLFIKKQAKRKAGKAALRRQNKIVLKTVFEIYVEELEQLLEPDLQKKTLGQQDCEALYAALQKLLHDKKHAKYELHLAMAVVLPLVSDLRLQGHEAKLQELLKESLAALRQRFDAGLNEEERRAWLAATVVSVRSTTLLRSDVFLFFIPRLMSFIKQRGELEKLSTALSKRRYKVSYQERFDKLMIAKLEVALRELKLFKTPVPAELCSAEAELIIARVELELCSHKITAAFNRLALNHDVIRQQHPFYYNAYLDYVITKARDEKKPHIEISYLEKNFMNSPHISPGYLKRYTEIVPRKELDAKVNELIAWLRQKPDAFMFDKTADLLFYTNRLDELTDEIRRQENKFSLLNNVLIKKLPRFSEDDLALYVSRLGQALDDAGYYHFQQRIFDKAMLYLGQLPSRLVQRLVSSLLDEVGRTKQISRYIVDCVASALR